MGITFIAQVDCTPAAGAFNDIDLDSYVADLGSDVTGVLLHIMYTGTADTRDYGIRKNGSTDNRVLTFGGSLGIHTYGMVGVDASHIFEVYLSSAVDAKVYIYGYTTSGYTFLTNGVDKSISSTGAWTDVDCSASAPSAIGLIFESAGSHSGSTAAWGLRKNGSTDNRLTELTYSHCIFSGIIGCDAGQVCENYVANTNEDLYLLGYITAEATFLTNATDYSISSTGSWTDMTALPTGALGGIFEIIRGSSAYSWGMRENGITSAAESTYKGLGRRALAVTKCDANRVCEMEISNTAVDCFLLGYIISPPGGTSWGGTWGG